MTNIIDLSHHAKQFVSLNVFRESRLRRPPIVLNYTHVHGDRPHVLMWPLGRMTFINLYCWSCEIADFEVEALMHQKILAVHSKLFLKKIGLLRLAKNARVSCLRYWNKRYSVE